jgi:hypothetical protein
MIIGAILMVDDINDFTSFRHPWPTNDTLLVQTTWPIGIIRKFVK